MIGSDDMQTSAVQYEIRLRGHLSPAWAGWFEGMDITLTPDGETVLTGDISDQAALYGVLKKVRDLGLPLHALNRLSDPSQNVKAQTRSDNNESVSE